PPGPNPWLSAPRPTLAHGGSDVRLGPVFWTLNVPAGYRVKGENATSQVGPVVYDLDRAAVLAELFASGDTAKKDSVTFARIDRLLQRADYRLNSQSGVMPGEVGPSGQSLADWSKSLRLDNPPASKLADASEAADRRVASLPCSRG